MKRYVIAAAALLLCSVCARSSFPFKAALGLKDDRVVSIGAMMKDLGAADMVFIGEDHGSQLDHKAQLEVIRELKKKGQDVAVGLEMFRAEDQRYLDQWTEGSLDTQSFLKIYYDNWRIPWPLYQDIFLFIKEKKIPVIGLNVPDAITEKVSKKGFGALSREELKQLPPGISCNVDPAYMEFIRRAYGAHGHGGGSFANFCEAQMVWDKAMAWHLIEYKKKHPARRLVVLAGSGHSWKPGIPSHVGQDSGFSFRVVLPSVPGLGGGQGISYSDADYLLLE